MKIQTFFCGLAITILTIFTFSLFFYRQAASATSACLTPTEQCAEGCAKYKETQEAYDLCNNTCNQDYVTPADWEAYEECQKNSTKEEEIPMTVSTLYLGADVHEGDTITTGRNEVKIIAFPDGSKVKIGSNSEMTIPSSEEVRPKGLGKFVFFIKKLTENQRKFRVRTNFAVISVRGTQFLVDTQTTGETTIKMLDGIVDVSNPEGTKTVQVQAGFELAVNSADNLGTPSKFQLSAEDQWYKDTDPFSDVGIEHPFYDAIVYLKDHQIVQGYSDGTYKPSSEINRAEFTKIIIATITQKLEGSKCFSDVQAEWFAPFVCYAKTNGIIGGYPDGTFKPNQNVQLAEALKIVLLALKVNLSENTGGNWYDVYINTANEHKILTNFSDTSPGYIINRGEMADVIYQLKR